MSRQSKNSATTSLTKTCATCGREIEWRKKWAKNWDEVKYCSDRCRGSRAIKDNHEQEILAILATRDGDKTMCPSEVLSEVDKQDKLKMEKVREAARRLVALGKIEIEQKGKVVDPSDFRGPIRLRLKK